MPWTLHSPLFNSLFTPRDTDTRAITPPPTTTMPWTLHSPLHSPLFNPRDTDTRAITPPPPPPPPRYRRRNTRQRSPARTPIRRRRSPTPPRDLLQLVAATAPRRGERVPSPELREGVRALREDVRRTALRDARREARGERRRRPRRRNQRGERESGAQDGGGMSPATLEEMRRPAEVPLMPVSAAVDGGSVYGEEDLMQVFASRPPRRSAFGTRPNERIRDPSSELDDYNGVMTRMPSPDVTLSPPPLLPRRPWLETAMERALEEALFPRRERAASPDVSFPLTLVSSHASLDSDPYGSSGGLMVLDSDDELMMGIPSPVMPPLPSGRAPEVVLPPQQRETERHLSPPRPTPWAEFTGLPVMSSLRPVVRERPNPNSKPKIEPEPITKPESEPEPEPEQELELTLPATAALLEKVASDLAAGTRRSAWRRVERALGGLRALHMAGAGAGSLGAGARAGGGEGGGCIICYSRPANSVFRPCGHLVLCSECSVTERVGSGPNGKWPVLFCPVAHCGAVVEAAIKVFRG